MNTLASSATAADPRLVLGREASTGNAVWSRLRDYLILTKPRIAVMVLVVVSVGYAVGCQGSFSGLELANALLGIGTIAAGCSVLNQWLEVSTDGAMRRTSRRPLPSGRVQSWEAFWLGTLLAVFGTVWLLTCVNVLTAWLTLGTLVAYVGVYTPLKRFTSLCTTIGAIPGAMPPVLGWTAAGRELDAAALALFGILFLWQFPHFLAIAWIYRDDYEQAGLKMLPRARQSLVVGGLAVAYAVVLIPVSLLPREVGLAGDLYFSTALLLGGAYLVASVQFARREDRGSARQLLWTSLVYLPVLLGVLTADHWRLLS
ncbi:MAG: heme o synthase [Planctomycetaceae bacterium]